MSAAALVPPTPERRRTPRDIPSPEAVRAQLSEIAEQVRQLRAAIETFNSPSWRHLLESSRPHRTT